MTEILISSQIYNDLQFRQMCGETLKDLQCNGQHGVMWAYKPYIIGRLTPAEAGLIPPLLCGNPRNIHRLSATLGQDNVVGVSKAMMTLRDTTAALAGSAASVHAARGGAFTTAVQRCQNALLAYRDVMHGKGAPGVTPASAGQAIHTAFANMQQKFQYELRIAALSQKRGPLKGTVLNNSTRAMNIARSSRHIQKLQLTSVTQATALGRFSQYGKVLGNGLVLIDVGSRVGNIHNEYKADGDWERELFIESSSFALSAVTGVIAVNAGTAALTFLTVATPVGWIGLIVTAAAASVYMNNKVKANSGGWYDEIMELVNSW
ncbi:hypothetical protein MNBD_GAMMA18-1216 [hydrothermal vent metagenome]|uniref:Uncharacterized protein n=1 Tax=hydrothermal vent metagenome TaxID=652676 RepID=A0A3B0ZEJ9_9ZZZZ